MATAFSNRINILRINQKDKEHLTKLFPYTFLQIATQENFVWVKNIPEELILSAIIQSIPSQSIYASAGGVLYSVGKLMPVGKLPVLTWLPIQEAIGIELPVINPNFFGIEASLELNLVPAAQAEKALFLLVNLSDLKNYLATAAAWRLEPLQWTIIGQYHALLKGEPMASLPGKAYWRRGQHILPLGLDLEWPIAAKAIAQSLSPTGQDWIFWQKNGQCSLLPKAHFKLLSRSSFHYTKALLQ